MILLFQILKYIVRGLGWLLHFFWNQKIVFLIYTLKREFVTYLKRSSFKFFGAKSVIGTNSMILKPQYISIGIGSSLGNRTTLACYDNIKDLSGKLYSPYIQIGNGVSIGEDAHISCINKILIGDNVLTGKKVLISDNAHGASIKDLLNAAPLTRPLVSKGPVIIEDNVWIGEKASILPGVHIGKGAIIGANAVVTKDVPPYSIVAGIPAIIIKQL